jgi:predicted amidohydrolase
MQLATSLTGSYIAHFKRLAVELDMAIATTYMEAVVGPGGEVWPPRNSVALLDRFGEIVYNYAKLHTCQFSGLEALHTAGRKVYAGVLNTKQGNVTVASIICFDREQPEVARMAARNGAELLLTPNACYLDNGTLNHFAVRGMENAAAVAMTNYASEPRWSDANNGQSVAYNHLGQELVRAGEEEGLFLAKVDIAAIRRHRASVYGAALLGVATDGYHPDLCELARREGFEGVGALGRMTGVL